MSEYCYDNYFETLIHQLGEVCEILKKLEGAKPSPTPLEIFVDLAQKSYGSMHDWPAHILNQYNWHMQTEVSKGLGFSSFTTESKKND
jgi:hypothetical protein